MSLIIEVVEGLKSFEKRLVQLEQALKGAGASAESGLQAFEAKVAQITKACADEGQKLAADAAALGQKLGAEIAALSGQLEALGSRITAVEKALAPAAQAGPPPGAATK